MWKQWNLGKQDGFMRKKKKFLSDTHFLSITTVTNVQDVAFHEFMNS